MQEPTQRHGHILDLIIYHEDDTFVKEEPVTSMLSDYFLVNIEISLKNPSVSTKSLTYRNYRLID